MMRRSIAVVAAVVFTVWTGLSGCSTSHNGAWAGDQAARHPLSPTELRIHPLTRFVRRENEGDFALDLHFELLDRWEHPAKALGEISVSLYGQDRARDGRGVLIRRWVIDLRDPDENARPYDRVTRTYRLMLTEIPGGAIRAETLRIEAQFVLMDGSRIKDETRIERSPDGDG